MAKTVSEQNAWHYLEESGFDLISICPSLVIGPILQSNTHEAVPLIRDQIVMGILQDFLSGLLRVMLDGSPSLEHFSNLMLMCLKKNCKH